MPTACPVALPSFYPSAEPSAVPSRLPTVSLSTKWHAEVGEFLHDSPLTASKRSVFIDMFTHGLSTVGGCKEWETYVGTDVARRLIDFVPVKLTLLTSDSHLDHERLYDSKVECFRTNLSSVEPVVSIVNGLKEAPITNSFLEINCGGWVWKVGSCSSGLPALCVNCTNPCFDASKIRTLNCMEATSDNYLNVLIIDFDPDILPPEIHKGVLVSYDKTSITAHLTMSEPSGYVLCAAHLSSSLLEPSDVHRLSLESDMIQIDASQTNVTMHNLEPSSSYDIFCSTFSILGQASGAAIIKLGVADTQCCRPLTATLTTSQFVDSSDYPNAVVIDIVTLPDDLTVEIFVFYTEWNNSNWTIVSPTPFSPTKISFSNLSVSTLESISHLQQTSGYYQLSLELSGSSSKLYEVVYSRGNMFEVASSFIEPSPPQLVSVTFTSDGTRIEVNFDTLTNRAGFVNKVRDCSLLFGFRGIDSDTVCTWVTDSQILLFLSGDGVVNVGDEVSLRRGVLKARCTLTTCDGWVWNEEQNMTISAPLHRMSPSIVMTGFNELGPCDNLILDISGSTGAGGRAWSSVDWSVESVAANRTRILAHLNSFGVTNIALPITVPSSFLQPGFGYNVIVTLCNFLEACGRRAHYFIVSEVGNVPVVTISAANAMKVYRHQTFSLSGSAFVYTCDGSANSDDINLEWRLYRNGMLQTSDTVTSISVDPNVFLLPKHSLSVGATYEVILTAKHMVSQKYSSASTSVSVKPGNVVTVLNVASEFGLKVSESIGIDASASFDEDQVGVTGLQAGLVFVFRCKKLRPKYSAVCDLDMLVDGATLSLSVPGENVTFVDYLYEVTVFVSHQSSKRSSQEIIYMTILPSACAAISLKSSSGVLVNPSAKLALVGSIYTPASGVAKWSVDDDSLDLVAASLSPVEKSLTFAGGESFSHIIVSLVVAGDSLSDGSSYVFTLSVILDNGFNSSSSVVVNTNNPPLPGGFSVWPTEGVELNTSFSFVAFMWEDIDLNFPLTYEFAAFSPLVDYSVFRSRHPSTSTTSQLAVGQSSLDFHCDVRVQVFDSLDGKSTLTSTVQVQPNRNLTNEILKSTLSNASTSILKETVHVVSGVLNSVSCDGAPNCAALHREICSSITDVCGLCLDGYYGEEGAANSECYPIDNGLSRRLASLIGTNCSSDNDCAEDFMEECNAQTLICELKQKQCNSNCAKHGSCQYISRKYLAGTLQSNLNECSVVDNMCTSQCVCDDGYAGPSCELSLSEFESAVALRQLLLQSHGVVISSENPTVDTVISWLQGLAGISSTPLYLSESAKTELISLCSHVLIIAEKLKMSYEDIQPVEKVLSLTLYGEESSSLVAANELLRMYARFIVEDFQIGQNPVEVVRPLYRLTAISADGRIGFAISMSRSSLEAALDVATQSVTLPLSGADVVFKAAMFETIATLHLSDTELLQSVPIELFVSGPLCNSSNSSSETCSANISLLNFEFGEQFIDESMTYFTTCSLNEQQLVSYSCPSGRNVSAFCNGSMNGVIESNCSVHLPTSRCEFINSVNSGLACSVIDFSIDETECDCPLPQYNTSWSVSFASVASSILSNSTSCFIPLRPVNTFHASSSNVNTQSPYIMYLVICVVMYFGAASWVLWPSKGLILCEESSSVLVNSPKELLEAGLPPIFRESNFFQRVFEEFSYNHRWSSAFMKNYDDSSSIRRLFALFSSICFVFLLNSLMHDTWPEHASKKDTIQICVNSVFIAVVGSPAFVMFDYVMRQYSVTTDLSSDEISLKSEYSSMMAKMKVHYSNGFLGMIISVITNIANNLLNPSLICCIRSVAN